MAKKIFLSPSDQSENLYAYGSTNEAVVCRKVADACEIALKRCGFEVKNSKTNGYVTRAKESVVWRADLHLAIHSNSHNGVVAGTRIFYKSTDKESYKASKAIYDVLAPLSPGQSDNITSYNELYEVRYPNATVCYIEQFFHDNITEAKWGINNIQAIAEAIAKGVCNYYGVKYVAANVSSNTNSSSKRYRVVCGSFEQRKNAEARQKELKAKGFDSFIDIK